MCFLQYRKQWKKKEEFDKVMNVSFLATFILYVPPCVLAYLYFGKAVQSPVLLSLGVDIASQLATIAITLHLLFTIPILSNPLNLWIEETIAARFQYSNRFLSHELVSRIILRTVILAVETIIAVTLPFFNDIMAFIGASTISATIFFLPCLFYLQLRWNDIHIAEKVWIFIILLFATLGSAVGLYTAVTGLVEHISHISVVLPDWFFYTILGTITYVGIIAISITMWIIHKDKVPSRTTPYY